MMEAVKLFAVPPIRKRESSLNRRAVYRVAFPAKVGKVTFRSNGDKAYSNDIFKKVIQISV